MKTNIIFTILIVTATVLNAQPSRRQSNTPRNNVPSSNVKSNDNRKKATSNTNNKPNRDNSQNVSVKKPKSPAGPGRINTQSKPRPDVSNRNIQDKPQAIRPRPQNTNTSFNPDRPARSENPPDNNRGNQDNRGTNPPPTKPDRNYTDKPNTIRAHDLNKDEGQHPPRTYKTPREKVRIGDVHINPHHPRPPKAPKPYWKPPREHDIRWTNNMYWEYRILYPYVTIWHIPVGTRIYTIPAYDAKFYIGDVKRVYGKVKEVYYSGNTDEYFIYIGDYYPYQDFTVVVPGYIARKFSRRPARYFQYEFINITGYITEFEEKPEIQVKRKHQLYTY